MPQSMTSTKKMGWRMLSMKVFLAMVRVWEDIGFGGRDRKGADRGSRARERKRAAPEFSRGRTNIRPGDPYFNVRPGSPVRLAMRLSRKAGRNFLEQGEFGASGHEAGRGCWTAAARAATIVPP